MESTFLQKLRLIEFLCPKQNLRGGGSDKFRPRANFEGGGCQIHLSPEQILKGGGLSEIYGAGANFERGFVV